MKLLNMLLSVGLPDKKGMNCGECQEIKTELLGVLRDLKEEFDAFGGSVEDHYGWDLYITERIKQLTKECVK